MTAIIKITAITIPNIDNDLVSFVFLVSSSDFIGLT